MREVEVVTKGQVMELFEMAIANNIKVEFVDRHSTQCIADNHIVISKSDGLVKIKQKIEDQLEEIGINPKLDFLKELRELMFYRGKNVIWNITE